MNRLGKPLRIQFDYALDNQLMRELYDQLDSLSKENIDFYLIDGLWDPLWAFMCGPLMAQLQQQLEEMPK